jgi:hypothetical protein
MQTVAYCTDAFCWEITNGTTAVGPVAGGQYWQMDCMTVYFPWIPPQLLAIGSTPEGGVAIASTKVTSKELLQLYTFNSTITATPTATTNPTNLDDGILYFAMIVCSGSA